MDDAEFDKALIAAAFALAGERGWHRVTPAEAARRGGFAAGAGARAISRAGRHSAALRADGGSGGVGDPPREGTVRDRLFYLLMQRMDMMQSHREGVLALLRALPSEPATARAAGLRHAAKHALDAGSGRRVGTRGARSEQGQGAGRRLAVGNARLAGR